MSSILLIIILLNVLVLSLSSPSILISSSSTTSCTSSYNVDNKKNNNNKKINSILKRSFYRIKGGNIDGTDDSKVKHAIDALSFENILKESEGKLIVVDFSASWCMPCKMIAPMFDEMANSDEYKDIIFVKIDVDENPETSEKYQIMSMPTFLFIKNYEVVDRFSGASVEKLKETIEVHNK
jgi:thioredoxin 1